MLVCVERMLFYDFQNFSPSRILINLGKYNCIFNNPQMEFKEFEPRFKSAKIRFKLSAGLNLETFDTILSVTNHI